MVEAVSPYKRKKPPPDRNFPVFRGAGDRPPEGRLSKKANWWRPSLKTFFSHRATIIRRFAPPATVHWKVASRRRLIGGGLH
jgi:hypothetical protein